MLTLNIHDQSSHDIQLTPGLHHVYVSGGYSVSLKPGFRIELRETTTSKIIPLVHTTKIRDRIDGKRVVRLFRFEIENTGNYTVRIQNPEQLTVKRSRLMSLNWLLGEVERAQIQWIIMEVLR